VPRPEHRDPVLGKTIELNPHWLRRFRIRSSGAIGRRIGRDDGLGASAACGLLKKLDVPIPYEAMVGIQLEIPVLTIPGLHDLRSRPTCPSAFPPTDVDHSNSRVFKARRSDLVFPVLPAHHKSKALGKTCLGHAVLDGWTQLRIAICRDRDEDLRVAGVARTDGSCWPAPPLRALLAVCARGFRPHPAQDYRLTGMLHRPCGDGGVTRLTNADRDRGETSRPAADRN
jgi:hypothetical protein